MTDCKVNGSIRQGAMCGSVGVNMNGGVSKCHAKPNICVHQSDYHAPELETLKLAARVTELENAMQCMLGVGGLQTWSEQGMINILNREWRV